VVSDVGVLSATIFKKKNIETRQVKTRPILSVDVTKAMRVKAGEK
jgi:hypothetical protein